MAQIHSQSFCRTCGRPTLHTKNGTNHILHLLLTLVTCGCWVVIWALDGLCHMVTRPRCTQCGG